MDTLRRSRRHTRLLLAWFALAVAMAAIAPGLQAQALEVICTAAGGVETLPGADADRGAPQGHNHQCALCAVFGVAPDPLAAFPAPHFAARPVHIPRRAFVAAHSAAPLGARGPPIA